MKAARILQGFMATLIAKQRSMVCATLSDYYIVKHLAEGYKYAAKIPGNKQINPINMKASSCKYRFHEYEMCNCQVWI